MTSFLSMSGMISLVFQGVVTAAPWRVEVVEGGLKAECLNLGCCNRIPLIGWLKQKTFISHSSGGQSLRSG